jgi:hypothetical protein
MKRIDTATVEADKFGAGKDGFTNGLAPSTPPTDLDCSWFDHVQEEICNIIEDTGGTLDDEDYGQLQDAVVAQIARGDGAVKATGATTTPALTVAPSTNTVSAERVGTQAAPSAAGLVGDRYTDTAGAVRTCRVAGTPGTFRAIGALGSRTLLVSGSGTYSTPVGCSAIFIRAVGGGGGGGYAKGTSAGTLRAVGGGGGGGGYTEKLIVSPAASYAYAVGAAGSGGVASTSTVATAGGVTSFGTTLVIANSGGAAASDNGSATSHTTAGGNYGSDSGQAGDMHYRGNLGRYGVLHVDATNTHRTAGEGASSRLGQGAYGVPRFDDTNPQPGTAGIGCGSGGAGGTAGGVDSNADGGDGAPGAIFIDEYY